MVRATEGCQQAACWGRGKRPYRKVREPIIRPLSAVLTVPLENGMGGIENKT